jgi:hypothetical protein
MLLAAAAGYPSIAQMVRHSSASDPTAHIIRDDDRHAEPGYATFANLTKTTFGSMPDVPNQDTVKIWIERVEQFAF